MSKPSIHALRQRKAELIAQVEKIVEGAGNRDLTPAETAAWDANVIAIKKHEVLIAEAEAVLNRERGGGGIEVSDNGPVHSESSRGAGKPRIGAKYGELFLQATGSSRDGFASMDDFIGTVHSGLADQRLRSGLRSGMQAAAGEQTEISPSSGGFLVPSEFAQQILDNSLESEVVRPRAMVWPMLSNSRKVPGIDGYSHVGGTLLGGITQAFVGEKDQLPLQQIKFWLLELVAKKMGLLIQSSNELLQDGSFDDIVGAKLREACAWELDNAFLWGTGAGVPRGVFNDPALVVIAKDSSQVAATITYSNVTNMLAALYPAGRKNAVWVASTTCLPQLMTLAIKFLNMAATDYVGGSSLPIFTKGPEGWELFGLPLILSEKLQTLGTQGDLLLADFSQYHIGLRKELTLERSWQAGFQTDSTWFRMTARLDGMGSWKSALTPEYGTAVSPFVTLATRS
jgi:HK97 family phage major capsid protein